MTTEAKIHPTAVVAKGAQLGAGVSVGPYCVIGAHVKLGDGGRLHSHVVLDGHTTIGPRCEFFPFACVGLKTQDLKFAGGTRYLEIGSDNVFREHVTAHTATADGGRTRIGSHNNFLAYAHIAHDCVVGDHVIFSNCGTLAGHVVVEDYAIVGGLAAVHQFCRIGTMAIIGGCSKVVQDVPPFTVADGNPAVVRGLNKVGLERNGVKPVVREQLRKAYKVLFLKKVNLGEAIAKARKDIPKSNELNHLLKFLETSERGVGR
jgi:UDP-N-acetylglucosamine acyltransferase